MSLLSCPMTQPFGGPRPPPRPDCLQWGDIVQGGQGPSQGHTMALPILGRGAEGCPRSSCRLWVAAPLPEALLGWGQGAPGATANGC